MTVRLVSSLLVIAVTAGCPVVFDDTAPPSGLPGRVALTRTTPEPAGDACPHGGARVEHGLDDDGDGVLSDAEVDGPPAFVCDGAPAPDVGATLVEIGDAAPPACPAGGQRLRAGRDADGDLALDEDEVVDEVLVCDGDTGGDGPEGLLRVSTELPGAACPAGGQRVEAGVDADDDGVLDDEEVALTRFLCDGEDGPTGAPGEDGAVGLVRVAGEPPGDNCISGGQRVETGVDLDGDGAIDGEEVEGVAYICDAYGEGVVLGAGRSEGTALAPVDLVLDASAPRLSTVGALSTSYYRFAPDAGAAPYLIEVTGEDSPLVVQLFTDSSLTTESTLQCTRVAPVLRCVTEVLTGGGTPVVAITDAAEVGNVFGLRVGLGADMGSGDAPVALTDGAGLPLALRASVGRGGESAFSFSVPAPEAYTVSLAALLGQDPGGLSWRIEDDVGVRARCADAEAPCSAGYLLDGVSYVLVVEAAGAGASFDVAVTEGDTVTPALPLDEVTPLDGLALPEVRVFQFRTTASTHYTFRSFARYGSRYLTVYDAPPETQGRHAYDVLSDPAVDENAYWISSDFDGYASFLAPDRVYYLAIIDDIDVPSDALFHIASRGGDESAVPVAIATPYAGSLARESSYGFSTGAAPSRYTVTLDAPFGAHNTILDVVLTDVGAATDVVTLETPTFARQGDDIVLVTPELPAGLAMTLSVFSYTSRTYTLHIDEGDTVTTPLAAGTPVAVTLPPDGVAWFALEATTPTAGTLAVTGGHARVLASDSWPAAAGDPGYTTDTAWYCAGTSCSGEVVLAPGRTFVSVENPIALEQTFTVGFTAGAIPLALDEPRVVELDEREAARFWYDNDSEVAHTVVVDNPLGRRFRFRLRRASDFGVEWESSALTSKSVSFHLPAGIAGGTLPTGAWILEMDGDNTFRTYPITITLTRP